MKTSTRDLLLLSRKEGCNEHEVEHEIQLLNNILFHAESMNNFCVANEVIDVNRYKVINKPRKIEQIIKRKLKPFVFVNNKN